MRTINIAKFAGLAGLCALAIAALPGTVEGRIKLATLPAKQNVQVRFDHPSLVFAEEERVIALQGPSEGNPAGLNTIDFSWAGTTIDKSSIVLRPVKPDPKVRILSTSYPPGENALTWQVACDEARSETFRIGYLMGAIGRETAYHVLINKDESSATLKHYFKIVNGSGESFEDTKFILGGSQTFDRDIENGASMRVLVKSYENIKIRKEYVYDVARSETPVLDAPVQMFYVVPNKTDAGLGAQPFDYGKVRIYQEDGKGGSAFIGEDWGAFTPVGDDMRLFVGVAQDIKIERKLMESKTVNIRTPVYDRDELWRYEIKNFKTAPVTVKIIDRIPGEWEYLAEGSTDRIAKRVNNEEVHFEIAVPSTPTGTPHIFTFHCMRKNIW